MTWSILALRSAVMIEHTLCKKAPQGLQHFRMTCSEKPPTVLPGREDGKRVMRYTSAENALQCHNFVCSTERRENLVHVGDTVYQESLTKGEVVNARLTHQQIDPVLVE